VGLDRHRGILNSGKGPQNKGKKEEKVPARGVEPRIWSRGYFQKTGEKTAGNKKKGNV